MRQVKVAGFDAVHTRIPAGHTAAEYGRIIREADLQPHVGTWIETAEETRYVLDRIDASLLGFGPDVGHLTWAGADPVELVEEYPDRVYGVHLKDLRREVRDASVAAGRSYRETVAAGLWIEPGRGDLDYERLWTALGADWDGTLVIEVD